MYGLAETTVVFFNTIISQVWPVRFFLWFGASYRLLPLRNKHWCLCAGWLSATWWKAGADNDFDPFWPLESMAIFQKVAPCHWCKAAYAPCCLSDRTTFFADFVSQHGLLPSKWPRIWFGSSAFWQHFFRTVGDWVGHDLHNLFNKKTHLPLRPFKALERLAPFSHPKVTRDFFEHRPSLRLWNGLGQVPRLGVFHCRIRLDGNRPLCPF